MQVHIHDPARGSIITAAAMAGDGGVVYLGTSSGRVERHRVVAAPDGHGARLSLVTTRHIGKKVWPAHGKAQLQMKPRHCHNLMYGFRFVFSCGFVSALHRLHCRMAQQYTRQVQYVESGCGVPVT